MAGKYDDINPTLMSWRSFRNTVGADFSDTVEIKLEDVNAEGTEQTGLKYPRGFHANVAGDVYIFPPNSSTAVKFTVVASQEVAVSIGKLGASTDAGLKADNAMVIGR